MNLFDPLTFIELKNNLELTLFNLAVLKFYEL